MKTTISPLSLLCLILVSNVIFCLAQPPNLNQQRLERSFLLDDTAWQQSNETDNVPRARAANVNGSGRISVATDPDGNETRNDIENVDVTCP